MDLVGQDTGGNLAGLAAGGSLVQQPLVASEVVIDKEPGTHSLFDG